MPMVMWAIILCGLLSLVYGAYTVRALMAANPGSARMQEIAGAIQEGAQAYLARQYTTIAVAGAVIFLIVGVLLAGLVAILGRRPINGLSRRRGHRPVGRGSRALGCCHLLFAVDVRRRLSAHEPHRRRFDGRARVWGFADLDLCPSRRRYFHQGC